VLAALTARLPEQDFLYLGDNANAPYGPRPEAEIHALTRAGVGTITIVDRDVVETTNLQRQILFDEADVADALPKAEAARQKLQRINSAIDIRAHVDDFNASNAEHYADGVDVIVDGLDNFETRYLLNDLAVHRGTAYIYGGAVGTTGMQFTVLPRPSDKSVAGSAVWTAEQATPCLRCVFPEAPPAGTSPTCDTVGVLGPVVNIVAAAQCAAVIKLLTGNVDRIDRRMLSVDLWTNQLRHFELAERPSPECPCCGQGHFDYLEGGTTSRATSLCGRDAVQIVPAARRSNGAMDFHALAQRLQPHGEFAITPHVLRGSFSRERGETGRVLELTLFANGRAIIKGTTEPELARTIYARYVGS